MELFDGTLFTRFLQKPRERWLRFRFLICILLLFFFFLSFFFLRTNLTRSIFPLSCAWKTCRKRRCVWIGPCWLRACGRARSICMVADKLKTRPSAIISKGVYIMRAYQYNNVLYRSLALANDEKKIRVFMDDVSCFVVCFQTHFNGW